MAGVIMIMPAIHQSKSLGGAEGSRIIAVVSRMTGVDISSARRDKRVKGDLTFPSQ
jgi:hypothetical protein